MATDNEINIFLSGYSPLICSRAFKLRTLILNTLPNITEQVDMPAKIIAYCYGQKYADLICVIIPSKTGLKLGFNRGTSLPDPALLLEGTGKISRYVQIKSDTIIELHDLKNLLIEALSKYKDVVSGNK